MMKAVVRRTKNLFIVNQWTQIGNQALDLAQILATSLRRSQSSLARQDGEIADKMQLFAVQFLSRCVAVERGSRQARRVPVASHKPVRWCAIRDVILAIPAGGAERATSRTSLSLSSISCNRINE